MQELASLRQQFLDFMDAHPSPSWPVGLYEPVDYILGLGGKKLRPQLVLMGARACGGSTQDALPAAACVEVFHNFSLLHDDIMDAAPVRRGQPTVHEKWDDNTAILSGDAMMIQSYRWLQEYPDIQFASLARVFTQTALQVCEGQQEDMNFEKEGDISVERYLKMIAYKTAVLVGASLQMGAITAGADNEMQAALYDFGLKLGVAFQIMDDYLDTFGDPETFGKQVGGDIIEGKQTYLYLKTLEGLTDEQQSQFRMIYKGVDTPDHEYMPLVRQVMQESGAADAAKQAIKLYTDMALQSLKKANLKPEYEQELTEFSHYLMQRAV